MKPIVDLVNDIVLYGLEKIGLYYSQYRGFVADINDPLNLNRIKVCIPEIYGEQIPNIWAWPQSNYSGNGYGIQCLPRKNELVWVSFEKGNKHKPLWTYGYFGKDEKPTEYTDPNLIWLITPKGNKVIINETTGEISIQGAGGKGIKIAEDTVVLGNPLTTVKPIAYGDTTVDKLESLIDIIVSMTVVGPGGPLPLSPDAILQLNQLKVTLTELKSSTTFTQ